MDWCTSLCSQQLLSLLRHLLVRRHAVAGRFDRAGERVHERDHRVDLLRAPLAVRLDVALLVLPLLRVQQHPAQHGVAVVAGGGRGPPSPPPPPPPPRSPPGRAARPAPSAAPPPPPGPRSKAASSRRPAPCRGT